MGFVEDAFHDLYPDRAYTYITEVKYTNKFKGFNANVKYFPRKNILLFGLSRQWKSIDSEIRMGLVQELLQKLFGGKIGGQKQRTKYMDYYHIFLKKVHIAIPKTKDNPVLAEIFDRLNDQYFHGLIEKPNLVFSGGSHSKLGQYEYGTDTITLSDIMRAAPKELLEYVMYHEMLHKKHKFDHTKGRSVHHSHSFKAEERLFETYEGIEERLNQYLISQRRYSFKKFSPEKQKGFFERLLDF